MSNAVAVLAVYARNIFDMGAWIFGMTVLGNPGGPPPPQLANDVYFQVGMLTLIGLVGLVVRRITVPKVRVVTSPTDWILFAMLLLQTISGISIALVHPWGSSWFASNLSPYLWSICKLNPDVTYIQALPYLVKFHIVLAFLTIGFFPFTRLVHVLVAPNPYLWRKPQVVRWYGQK